MTEATGSPHSLEEQARQLATALVVQRDAGRPRDFRRRVAGLRTELRGAVQDLGQAGESTSAIAAEWLLDNEHLALRAVDQVSVDLPTGFFRRLPKVQGEGSGRTRVDALAREYLTLSDGFVDLQRARQFVSAFQSVTPLNIAEVWALPAFLRLLVVEEIVAAAHRATELHPGSDVNERMSAAISSLRVLDSTDWKEFFESVSVVDRYLRLDPNGVYSQLDFDTRDSYREALEELARWGTLSESGVARSAIEAVREAGYPLGAFLIGSERKAFEDRLECRAPAKRRVLRFFRRHAGFWYFGGTALTSLGALLVLLYPVVSTSTALPLASTAAALVLALVPATSLALALSNEVATRASRPRRLPRLDLSRGIPDDLRTLAAIPALLTDVDEVGALLRQLEISHRGNSSENLPFALLADPVDADQHELPGDEPLVALAAAGIRDLNERYSTDDGRGPFLLLTRNRAWNPAEGRWMAWERKRGKLHELNRLLLGESDSGIHVIEGDPDALMGVKYVLTLDADTFLPQGTAARLIGTLAHPLHAPRFDVRGRVVEGYTILQPRVQTLADSTHATRFSRIYQAHDGGFDLYSHAASDVYQDLFREGVFVGKGLYDIQSFERSLEGRVPDNALLSHDLFEGVHGRTALVTDVPVIEYYPSHPMAYMRRLHRWVRGDWQIMPWLFRTVPAGDVQGAGLRNDLTIAARWKIFDNLRRSLLATSLVLLTVVGWWWLPGHAWWSVVPLAVLGLPILVPEIVAATSRWRSPRRETVFRTSTSRIGWAALRWLTGITFLPWQAAVEADAIGRTLYRLFVTRRNLLQWTPAAAIARSVLGRRRFVSHVRDWAPAWLIPLAIGGCGVVLGTFAWASAPLLSVWLLAPALAWVLTAETPWRRDLSDDEVRRLRRLARRTWAYFDRFVTAEHHWLPPDNVQLRPVGAMAHRTSPTNIGFGMLAQLVGSDRGFVPPSHLAATLASTLDTIDRLEKHRGHLLNWYDTNSLRSLAPSYVSSVDSGNLAACAVTIAEGLRDLMLVPLPSPRYADGMVDGLEVLAETLEAFRTVEAFKPDQLPALIRSVAEDLDGVRLDGRAFVEHLSALTNVGLPTIESEIADALESGPRGDGQSSLGSVREWVRGLDRQAMAIHNELEELVPWLGALSDPPRLFVDPTDEALDRAWRGFIAATPIEPLLRDIPSACSELLEALESLGQHAKTASAGADEVTEARLWLEDLTVRVHAARQHAHTLLEELGTLQARLHELVRGMDFRFLYEPTRKLLRIGYHVGAATPDRSCYDLYASEARLASFIAIAKGDIPVEHWTHLGRPFARRHGTTVLLSWSGTMFEYLMPSLFFRAPPDSLGDVACRRAVDAQIRYGRRHRVPWGVSESGFSQTDSREHYRYRAFGVGALGVRWDRTDRVVTAPYASVLALPYDPRRVVRNLRRLDQLGMRGALGFYEAADFGARGARSPQVVHSYMAHHQGMALAALDNFLTESVLVERFHRDPRVATYEYLLQEAAPGRVRAQPPPALPRAGAGAHVPPPPTIPTWTVEPDVFPTPTTVVSNGVLSSLLTANGSGGLRWRGRDILRWRPDPTVQSWGTWIYVRDVESDSLWSATLAPTWAEPDRHQVVFGADAVEFQREDDGITMRTTVTVAASSDVEIRRVTIVNESTRPRTLELTSYAEVALADPGEDRRHPAFSKLFVEGRYAPKARALLLERRIRGNEAPAFLAHAIGSDDPDAEPLAWELSREAFLGRGGNLASPRGVFDPVPARGAEAWAPLDPIVSLTTRVEVPPGGDVSVAFLTAVADAPGTALGILDACRSPDQTLFAANQSHDRERALLHNLSVDGKLLPAFQRLLTAMVFPYHSLRRPSPDAVAAATPHQESLWAAGVSGDLPVVLVETEGKGDPLLDEVVKAQAYWARHGVRFDVVAVSGAADGYEQPLRGHLARLLEALGLSDRLDRPGGVHHVSFGRLADHALRSLRAAASVALVEDGRSLSEHLEGLERGPSSAPPFVPVPRGGATQSEIEPVSRPTDLHFDNGFGGFSTCGDEYVMHLEPGESCPAPWSNVVAHESFGFLVSETGGGFTWLGNSGERRLTAWRNDPVTDLPSEVLYLRDEETSDVWSATPAPAPAPAAYQIAHRPGSTTFQHRSHGLVHRLDVFVVPDEPVKVAELTLTNEWHRPRRLTATYYAEWVLGAQRSSSGPHVTTEVSLPDQAIIARNRFAPSASGLVAFLGASEPIHTFTCDRSEFLGPQGSLHRPTGLARIGLEGRVGAHVDPCAALQVHLDLAVGETRTIRFLLGAGGTTEEASRVLSRFRDPVKTPELHTSALDAWQDRLDRITVRTPEPAMDLMLNRWLLYQTVSCRLWGRSGLYQSSGAFGFRDQLQDSLALRVVAPEELARLQILEAARHQFMEGDVLHWWHAEQDRGVRTRCSDDLLWLPFAVAEYVEATGEVAILDEPVTFLDAPTLEPHEMERYDTFGSTGQRPLYEHCLAALERAGARSERGLPLIGSGDWNDAMNRVGPEGRGESMWLAWFLHAVETRFARIAERRGDMDRAAHLRSDAERLRGAVETHGWDGAWYQRATYDDGTPIGTSTASEGRIDSLTQSWAVLSGGADPERARIAMTSVSRDLIRPDDRLVLLLTPPFHRTRRDPGYIRAYPPGVRENGGQYTHAAAWVGLAFAAMGEGDQATEVFRLLNPILHAKDSESARAYRVEPYVLAGDVYGAPPHTGRGGWTWYTGSAGWLYRLGMEGILGLRPAPTGLEIRPCIPSTWEGYEARVRTGAETLYRVVVRNPHRVATGPVSIHVDGQAIEGSVVPLDDDGQAHEVEAVLGFPIATPGAGPRDR